MALLQKREDRCIGWHCLTDAQKFGVIFSACVVTIVLAVAWMCYLGKAANAHRQRFSTPLPGGRRAPRYPSVPSNTAVGQLPVVQQWPGHPPQIYYQPVIYRLDSQQPPQAYPYPGIELSQRAPAPAGQMPIAFAALPQPHVPALPATAVPRQTARTSGPESSDSSQRCEDQEYSLGWRKRLNRLFRLPVGRASTIASSERPRRSESRSTRDSSRRRPEVRRSSEGSRHHNPVVRVESPARGHSRTPIAQQRGGESDDLESLDTNVATVHSDDYDLPLRSNAPRREPQHEPVRSTYNQPRRNLGIESNDRDANRVDDDSDSFPSVSSMSTEDENPSQPLSQRGQRTQTCQPHFRGPGESDLGTQSSVSVGRDVLSRENARTRWERRNSSTIDSEPNVRGPETPLAAHRSGGR